MQTEPSELERPVAFAQAPFPVWPEGGKAPPSMDPREERRRELLLAAAAVLLFVLFVGGLEGALRVLHVRADDGELGPLHVYSETYGWEPRKGFRMVEDGRTMTINGRGYRGPELPAQKNRTRVVVLGDSVGFGQGAGDDETFAHLLDARADLEVANLSVPGYDPGQELIKLEREGLPLKPDIVILALCLSNDFADVALPVFLYDGLHPKPFFRIEGARLVEHSEQLRLSLRQRVALFLQEHSRLYGLVEARRAEAAPRAEIEHWTQRREKALKNRSGVIDLTARLLGRMAEDCQRAGVAFVVLAFPDKETFRGDKSWLEGLTTSLSEENISVVDMAERFQARGLLFSEIASDNIGHLSARGHVAASEIVREVLVERSLAAP